MSALQDRGVETLAREADRTHVDVDFARIAAPGSTALLIRAPRRPASAPA